MNKYVCISLCLMLLFCQTAFSLQGSGFKIINDNVETNSNGFTQNINLNYAKSNSYAYDRETVEGKTVILESDHSVVIRNDTNQKQIYKWDYALISGDQFVRKCFSVELAPCGFVSDCQRLCLPVRHKHSGQWQIFANTNITGESYDRFDSYAHLNVK